MPGSVKVSVLEADQLPSPVKDGDWVSVRVSVGKREFQTKPSQSFGGRTAPWRYEFSYPVTNLRDNLVIAALDSNDEIITKSEIQTTSIIQKGLWQSYFSFKGGGRLYLRLCFVLSDEEKKKIEMMRREALRRRGLQNLLYRSAFPMPKPPPVKPTFVSGVTITEIRADSCLYEKDEDKENRAANISVRCAKLLEAPKEKKSLDIENGSHAIMPFSQHLDDGKLKANISDGPLSQKLVSHLSREKNEKKVSKTTEDPSKGAHLYANCNVPSLLLPEASELMNELVPSTVASDDNSGNDGMLCGAAAVTTVANIGSLSTVSFDKVETLPKMEPVMESLSSLEDASNTQPPSNGNAQNDKVSVKVNSVFGTIGGFSDELTTTKEMLNASETLSDKVNHEMPESETVKDAVKKLALEKEAEEERQAALSTGNKVLKSLPWKSQLKGAPEKFGFNVSKKKRAEDQLLEPAVSEKAESKVAVEKEMDEKNGFFGISGRVQKWAGVALLLAGVVILGYDAIQRDLAAKESYSAAKQGDKLHNMTSTKKASHNMVKISSVYAGQQIQLH